MRALIISADNFEDAQLLVPYYWMKEEGIEIDIASVDKGPIRGRLGFEVEAGITLREVRPYDYEVLLLPGGSAAEEIRTEKRALDISTVLFENNMIIAAVDKGLLPLISAGLMYGRYAACNKSIISEIKRAGVLYGDKGIVTDGKLITCRRSADLPAFSKALIKLIGKERWHYMMQNILVPCMN